MKRKIAAVIAAVALIGLGVAVAVGGAGEDPLVAKSYMEDTYPAALVQALEKRASEGTKGTYSQSIAKLDKAGEADVKAAEKGPGLHRGLHAEDLECRRTPDAGAGSQLCPL